MNEPIEFRIETTNLTAEEQILLQALGNLLMSGRPELVRQYLQVLHRWDKAPVQRRALALKLMDQRLPSKMVAQICGLSDRQLRRYAEYQRFARLLNPRQGELPPGQSGGEGDLEAWFE